MFVWAAISMAAAEGAAVAGDEERHFTFAHQKYRSVKYREASEHGSIVYEKVHDKLITYFFLELSTVSLRLGASRSFYFLPKLLLTKEL